MRETLYSASALGLIYAEGNGKYEIHNVGCGCCSDRSTHSKDEVIAMLEAEIAELQALLNTLKNQTSA